MGLIRLKLCLQVIAPKSLARGTLPERRPTRPTRRIHSRGKNNEQDRMKKLAFVAAALAAGMTAFVSTVQARSTNTGMPNAHEMNVVYQAKGDTDTAEDGAEADAQASEAEEESRPVAAQSPYDAIISRYAQKHGIPLALAHAVIRIESNYRAEVTGGAGEIGLMQIKPATARMMGHTGNTQALYDPETNIRFGMRYLAKARQLGGGDTCGTILRYNAGHGATRMNPVSANYCAMVKRHLAET